MDSCSQKSAVDRFNKPHVPSQEQQTSNTVSSDLFQQGKYDFPCILTH